MKEYEMLVMNETGNQSITTLTTALWADHLTLEPEHNGTL